MTMVRARSMDTGLGTLVKTSFDNPAKCIYTWPDAGRDQFLYAL
jgi:hypothetical protein